jgi:hypothetical protein
MNRSELEHKLKSSRLDHLTEDELLAYRDQELDEIVLSRADAHLALCLLCEKALAAVREELTALESVEVTPEDFALAKRVIEEEGRSIQPLASGLPTETQPSLAERLAEYLHQLTQSWQNFFLTLEPVRGTVGPGMEIQEWVSDDALFFASITIEDTSDITIHISSKERGLAGQRIRVSLGSFSGETTLRRASQSEVYGKVTVPELQRPARLDSITIEKA